MARRNKPHDPAATTRAMLERKDREAEKARLEQSGATVKVDNTGKIISAYRSNVFNLLLQRGTITPNHHDAAHRLCVDWAAWKGLDGKPETFGEFVDGGSGCGELVTQRMIEAGKRVAQAFAQIAYAERLLLTAFMVATVEEDRPMLWRGIVERTLGEDRKDRQTLAAVSALEALRRVYEQPRRKAA